MIPACYFFHGSDKSAALCFQKFRIHVIRICLLIKTGSYALVHKTRKCEIWIFMGAFFPAPENSLQLLWRNAPQTLESSAPIILCAMRLLT